MNINFSTEEYTLLTNPDILLAKRRIQDKVFALLEQTQLALRNTLDPFKGNLAPEITMFTGKISRGENYRQLPYMILDYPALFSKEDIFAYRTMFYWGNFFSTTLHLQGKYLADYRQMLYATAGTLITSPTYIGIGTTPWQYHYGHNNYVLLTENNKEHMLQQPFLKLSRKISLNQWQTLPAHSAGFLQTLLKIMTSG